MAAHVLDELLGLNPMYRDAPEKIYKVVSQWFAAEWEKPEGGYTPYNPPSVDLMFETQGQQDADEPPRAFLGYNSRDDWNLEKVEKDCAALVHLGFDLLQTWRGGTELIGVESVPGVYMTEEDRAQRLIAILENAGELHGLMIVQGHVVLRNGGPVHVTDSPTMLDVADLEKAIELGLLQENTYRSAIAYQGEESWNWWVLKPEKK